MNSNMPADECKGRHIVLGASVLFSQEEKGAVGDLLLVCQGALYSVSPSCLGLFDLVALGHRLEGTLHLPLALDFVDVFPESYGQTCEISGTESCRLRDLRTYHRDAEEVGLELHEQVVAGSTAVEAPPSTFSSVRGAFMSFAMA